MKIPIKRLTTAVLAAAALASPLAAAVESKDPIKLTIHDWTGQYITTHIMGAVLEEMGYNVEYVQADYIAAVRGPGGRRFARRHGDVGNHRQGRDGSIARHRENGRF